MDTHLTALNKIAKALEGLLAEMKETNCILEDLNMELDCLEMNTDELNVIMKTLERKLTNVKAKR